MKLDEMTWQDTLPALNLRDNCHCVKLPTTCECSILHHHKVDAYRAAARKIEDSDPALWEQLCDIPPGRCTFDLVALAAGAVPELQPTSLRYLGQGWVPTPECSNLESLYDPYDKRVKVNCSLIDALPSLNQFSRLPHTLPMTEVDYFDSQPDRVALQRDVNSVQNTEGFVRSSHRAELELVDESKFCEWVDSAGLRAGSCVGASSSMCGACRTTQRTPRGEARWAESSGRACLDS